MDGSVATKMVMIVVVVVVMCNIEEWRGEDTKGMVENFLYLYWLICTNNKKIIEIYFYHTKYWKW